MLVDDPSIYLADFGVTVTSGAVSGLGILDMPTEIIVDSQVLSTDYTLVCEASKFGNLLYNSQINVNGTAYTVRSTNLLSDGVFVQLSLQRSVETPYITTETAVDANGVDALIDDLGIEQVNPEIDGGSPDSTYIEGNEFDGGTP